MPLAFQNQSATLTAEDKRRLDDVARLLKSKEAKDLRIVVSSGSGTARGQSERAQAVVDYLDRHGIARDRLQADAAAERGAGGGNGLVLMEIVGGGAPVAGLPASAQEHRR